MATTKTSSSKVTKSKGSKASKSKPAAAPAPAKSYSPCALIPLKDGGAPRLSWDGACEAVLARLSRGRAERNVIKQDAPYRDYTALTRYLANSGWIETVGRMEGEASTSYTLTAKGRTALGRLVKGETAAQINGPRPGVPATNGAAKTTVAAQTGKPNKADKASKSSKADKAAKDKPARKSSK